MPTAFLTASTFEVLPFLGTPGAATVGHTLLWSESPKGFTLSPISVGPDQFSGVLPISKGGTGTSNGSITGTGALTFAAGGTNQNITLHPSGTGKVIAPNLQMGGTSNYQITLGGAGATNGIALNSVDYDYLPWPGEIPNLVLLNSRGFNFTTDGQSVNQFAPYSTSLGINIRANRNQNLFTVYQATPLNRGAAFYCKVGIGTDNASTYFHVAFDTESTSTTTGCAIFSGGVGVQKNINIGGNLRFAGGTVPATATSAGTTGDIRYDGSHLYICTATNTWVRTALSTW